MGYPKVRLYKMFEVHRAKIKAQENIVTSLCKTEWTCPEMECQSQKFKETLDEPRLVGSQKGS